MPATGRHITARKGDGDDEHRADDRHTVGARIAQFDHTRSDRSLGEDLTTLVRLVADARPHPEIGTLRPWTDTAAVVAEIRERRLRGNAVLSFTAVAGAAR